MLAHFSRGRETQLPPRVDAPDARQTRCVGNVMLVDRWFVWSFTLAITDSARPRQLSLGPAGQHALHGRGRPKRAHRGLSASHAAKQTPRQRAFARARACGTGRRVSDPMTSKSATNRTTTFSFPFSVRASVGDTHSTAWWTVRDDGCSRRHRTRVRPRFSSNPAVTDSVETTHPFVSRWEE